MSKSKIIESTKKIAAWLRRYRYLVTVGVIALLFAFTVWRIDYVSSTERDEQVYEEELSRVETVKFDEAVIKRLEDLRPAGVNVRPQFPGGRTNPFE